MIKMIIIIITSLISRRHVEDGGAFYLNPLPLALLYHRLLVEVVRAELPDVKAGIAAVPEQLYNAFIADWGYPLELGLVVSPVKNQHEFEVGSSKAVNYITKKQQCQPLYYQINRMMSRIRLR